MRYLVLAIVVGFLSNAVYAAPPAKTAALLQKGRAAYAANCVTCHGEHGDGNGRAGMYLNPRPRNFGVDKFKNGDKVEQVFESITQGLPGTPMVSWAALPEEDRWGLAYYVLSTFRKKK